MDKQKYTIYEGEEYTIEWYFDDRGKKPAEKYFDELEKSRKDKIVELFRLMGDEGEIKNIRKFRHEGDQIYAFKSSFDRFFCFFFDDSKVNVTNACEKKSDKMPPNEKAKALKFRSDYRKRCTVGKYYE